MAIVKAITSRASIARAVRYVTKTEKTEVRLVSGIACNPATAIDEMRATKELYGKTGGRSYKHLVISFPPDEKITPKQAHEMALRFAKENLGDRFEVVIATHKDKKHVHTHFIINSVSHLDGKKYQQSKRDLQRFKDNHDQLCRENGFSVTEKKGTNLEANENKKYRVLEKALNGENNSFLLDCLMAVRSAKSKAKNRQEFAMEMAKAGWRVIWNKESKYVTFADEAGHRVRNIKLEKTFGGEDFSKTALQQAFDENYQTALRPPVPATVVSADELKAALAELFGESSEEEPAGQALDDEEQEEEQEQWTERSHSRGYER